MARDSNLKTLELPPYPGANLVTAKKMTKVGGLRCRLNAQIPVVVWPSGLPNGPVDGTEHSHFQSVLRHTPTFTIVEYAGTSSRHFDGIRLTDHALRNRVEADQ